MADLSDEEIAEIRKLLKRDAIARGAAAYIRTILVWLAAVIGACTAIWLAFRDLVQAAAK